MSSNTQSVMVRSEEELARIIRIQKSTPVQDVSIL